MCCQQDEEWSQYYYVQYFGNNCCVFCIWVDGMICCYYLCYFVYSRINVDIESFRIKLLRYQWIYCWVEENCDGFEDNNGCNSYGYFIGFCFYYWFSCQYCGSIIDIVIGID